MVLQSWLLGNIGVHVDGVGSMDSPPMGTQHLNLVGGKFLPTQRLDILDSQGLLYGWGSVLTDMRSSERGSENPGLRLEGTSIMKTCPHGLFLLHVDLIQ